MKSFLLLLTLISFHISNGQVKIKTDTNSRGDTVHSTIEKKIYTMPGARNAIGEIVKSSIYKLHQVLHCALLSRQAVPVFLPSAKVILQKFF